MHRHWRSRVVGAALTGVLAAALLIPAGGAEAGKGNGGGGKPPKDPPEAFVPVIVYQRADEIIVADETAQSSAVVHRLGGGFGGTAAWSPDGTEIVFVDLVAESADCDAGWALVLLDVAGALEGTASPRCLLNLGGQSIEVNSPAWSANGIVYGDLVETAGGANWDLFAVDPEAVPPEPVNLTQTEAVDEEGPSWSPDGNRIVYVERTPDSSDILVSEFILADPPALAGTFSLSLQTPVEGMGYLFYPDWSNTSSQIVFEADDVGDPVNAGIWVLDADDPSVAVKLTGELEFGIGLPSWSGDDSRIVFLTDVENTCNFKRKDRNGWQLGITSSTEPASSCVEAFIGPPGTNIRLDFPRSLDWYPGVPAP